jgi:tRNA (guanine37-N1)-methyltransferase
MLICGRYEGFDERIRTLASREISLGDFVLTGGEVAALAVLEATARLLPGVLGSQTSIVEESFSDNLLEYPHYTRPAEFEGMAVPEELLSGDHRRIALWRRFQQVKRTLERRPDLLEAGSLAPLDELMLQTIRAGRSFDEDLKLYHREVRSSGSG